MSIKMNEQQRLFMTLWVLDDELSLCGDYAPLAQTEKNSVKIA